MRQSLLPALPFFLFFLPTVANSLYGQCDNPNSTFEFVGNVTTYFCEGPNGGVTVDVTVDENNDPACIDRMILDWDDGTSLTLGPTDFGNYTHYYDFEDSIACELSPLQLNPLVTLTLVFKNGKVNIRAQSLSITLLPRGFIAPTPPYCVGEPVLFGLMDSCYVDSVFWDFGGGQTSTSFGPAFTWNTPGLKLVKLCVYNECGSNCTERYINIRERPDVSAINYTAVPSSGCFPVEMTFTPTVKGVDDYDWSVIPQVPCSGCYAFMPPTGVDSIKPVIRFNKEGTYTVQLIGKNPCGRDTFSVEVQAFAPPNVNLAPSPPGCKTLSFKPTVTYLNLNPGSISSYNWAFPKGTPKMSTDSMPMNIQYVNNGDTVLIDTVKLTVTGPCGTQTYSTIVRVYGNTDVSFINPPTQVCTGNEPFFIVVTPPPPTGVFMVKPAMPSGAFNISTGLLTPSLLVQGTTYTITYTVDAGPNAPDGCESKDSISFTVLFSQVFSIAGPDSSCVDGPPFQLAPIPPANGVWVGKGITNPNTGAYSPAQAMAGLDTVQFSFTDNLTGCKSEASHILEIVGIPQVTPPNLVLSCDIAQGVLLETLDTFIFSPAGGAKSWSGTGIVNPQTGEFVSPGVGTYNITVHYELKPFCDTTVTFVVQVDSFVMAFAGTDDIVCQSKLVHTLTGSPSGGRWSGSPNIDPITGEINLAAESPGPHDYIYTIRKDTPCESSDMVQINIVPGDGVSITQPLDYVCETAATYTLPNASPAGGAWNGPSLTGNVVNVAALNPDTFIYTYEVANLPDDCNNATFTLIVTAQPSADFVLTPDTVCVGETVTVVPVATGDVMFVVNWGDSNSGAVLSHNYSGAGDFSVMLTATTKHPLTGLALCTNSLSKNAHVVAPPQLLEFSMDKDSGCSPLLVTFTNLSIAENGQYVWDFGNDSVFVGFEPGPILFQQGIEDTTYIVKLTVLTGCDSMVFSKPVKVLPQPHADFGITYDEPCSGGILKLNNTSTGSPTYTKWTTSTGQTFTTFNPPLLQFFTDSLPKIVEITLIDTNLCGKDTLTKFVTINPTDVIALINISDTTEVCVGDTVTLTSFSTPNAPISWKTSEGNTFLQNPLKLVFADSGLYKVTLRAEGCGYDSMDMYVRVHPSPSLTVEHPQIICPGDTALFKIVTPAAGSLLYFGTGDSSDLKIARHRYLTSGNFQLQAIATSLVGCKNYWNGSLDVALKPDAVAEASDSVCARTLALFNSLSANDLSCVWDFGDDDLGDGCTVVHTYADPGLYTAALTVISPIGCRDTAFVPVYVRATPSALPIFQILKRCTPAEVLFSSQSTGATGLEWDFGDGTTASTASVTKIYNMGGIYQVQLIATNEGICSDTGEVLVELWQTPLFDFDLIENCAVAEGTDLAINTAVGNVPTVTGPGYQQDGSFHQGLVQGYYDVSIISPEGCENDTTVFIPKPIELLLKVAEDSFSIFLGQKIQLDAVVNQLGVQFKWEPGIWLESDTIASPKALPFRNVTYYVTATALNGCTKADTVFVAVMVERDSGLYIPDIFTPNESPDGINDVFFVRSVNPSVDFIEDFKVLDKHGEIVHNVEKCPAEQIVFGWDGTFKGEKAEMGVYRWQLVVVYKDGVRVPKSGLLMLAR